MRVVDGGGLHWNVGGGAASHGDSGGLAGVASSGSRDNAFSLSSADLAVRIDDGVGRLGCGLVDVSGFWCVGFASADRSEFAECGSLPDSVPALGDSDVVGDRCGDWVDVGRIAGCGREVSCVGGRWSSAGGIIGSRDWTGT